jgi:hypothetical protein
MSPEGKAEFAWLRVRQQKIVNMICYGVLMIELFDNHRLAHTYTWTLGNSVITTIIAVIITYVMIIFFVFGHMTWPKYSNNWPSIVMYIVSSLPVGIIDLFFGYVFVLDVVSTAFKFYFLRRVLNSDFE